MAASDATNRISWSNTLRCGDADLRGKLGVDEFQAGRRDRFQDLIGSGAVDEELDHDGQFAREFEEAGVVPAVASETCECAKRRAAGNAEFLRAVQQPLISQLAVMAARFRYRPASIGPWTNAPWS